MVSGLSGGVYKNFIPRIFFPLKTHTISQKFNYNPPLRRNNCNMSRLSYTDLKCFDRTKSVSLISRITSAVKHSLGIIAHSINTAVLCFFSTLINICKQEIIYTGNAKMVSQNTRRFFFATLLSPYPTRSDKWYVYDA